MDETHIAFMQRALDLAGQAKGRTSPNPLVGAVIVKDGKVIGEGYHKKAGTPH
ncbi:MAG: riboflavin biosynthesis protein RibD, partial [Candidatus Poribacteria bacterium]|nr:riboflavin biosynthesis protein RibD [Candidatus Poribacteria bacterium]